MKTITPEMMKKGYFVIPKALLEERMKRHNKAESGLEAFFLVLMHANYSATECNVLGRTVVCQRGESMNSLNHWSQIFGWNRSKTQRFFNRMFDDGSIEKLVFPGTLHIRIPQYDLWTSCQNTFAQKHGAANEAFTRFWEYYHKVTGMDKVNIAHARRVWQKLSPAERIKAYDNVEEYYFHLNNVRYCKQAAKYLEDKAFLNEYLY